MATSSIGSGKTYTTVQLWEDATDNDLVTATEGEIGEVYGAVNHAAAITIGGATADATYYRHLRPASGEGTSELSALLYDGATGGAITCSANYTSVIIHGGSGDDYFRFEGLQIRQNGNGRCLSIAGATDVWINKCLLNTTGSWDGDIVQQDSGSVWSSNMAIVAGTNGVGFAIGGNYQAGDIGAINCGAVATNVSHATSAGFQVGAADYNKVRNCWADGFGGNDFSTGWHADSDENSSGDTSAPGSTNYQSTTLSDNVVNATTDFFPKSGDVFDGGGTTLASYEEDILEVTRAGACELGPADLVSVGGGGGVGGGTARRLLMGVG